MKTQDIFIAHPKNAEQTNALKAFMQALKIKFEVTQSENYDPAFIQKVLKGRSQAKADKVTRVSKDKLKAFLGA